jgi:hypothetical protein
MKEELLQKFPDFTDHTKHEERKRLEYDDDFVGQGDNIWSKSHFKSSNSRELVSFCRRYTEEIIFRAASMERLTHCFPLK